MSAPRFVLIWILLSVWIKKKTTEKLLWVYVRIVFIQRKANSFLQNVVLGESDFSDSTEGSILRSLMKPEKISTYSLNCCKIQKIPVDIYPENRILYAQELYTIRTINVDWLDVWDIFVEIRLYPIYLCIWKEKLMWKYNEAAVRSMD